MFYKDGLDEIVKQLNDLGIEIYSTGGTYNFIKDQGVEAKTVESLTSYPSILGGRVKTLHPKVFGGILARRELAEDQAQLAEYEIPEFDLVIVDLYPFEETVAGGGTEQEIIEKIDIGGISLIRAAAKNFKDVIVVSDPNDYNQLIEEWSHEDGITLGTRKIFAQKVFETMAEYNNAIAKYMMNNDSSEMPDYKFDSSIKLRYGENPHQSASLLTFSNLNQKNIANAEIIQGKELSYNNIVDADAAWECVKEFDNPACVIVKHANPCGVAESAGVFESYDLAFKTDPTSAFGGIIAFNKKLDAKTAIEINKRQFVELIIATDYEEEALNELSSKKNIRVLKADISVEDQYPGVIKKVSGGILIQDDDHIDLANKIEQICEHKFDLNKISKSARAKIERDNSIYGEMKKMVDLYLSAGK